MRIEDAPFIADESTNPNEIPTEALRRVVKDVRLSRYVRMIANAIVVGREKWPPLARSEMTNSSVSEL
jgi:hypothetical protein